MGKQGIFGFVAIGVFLFVVWKMMEKFGLIKSKEDVEFEKDDKIASSSQETPWSPNYYKKAKGKITLITKATAESYADRIEESIGHFYDDEDGVYSVFRMLKTKAQLSFLVDIFNRRHKQDLYNFLDKNFNDKEMQVCIDIVKSLK